jgi:hypothetical protein
MSELFEKTRIVVDGTAKEVAHLIPGALDHLKVTPEMKSKVARVAANCDAEIIHALMPPGETRRSRTLSPGERSEVSRMNRGSETARPSRSSRNSLGCCSGC